MASSLFSLASILGVIIFISSMIATAEGATSVVRQNYHLESETGINNQINWQLHASYIYLSMASYFDRDDVALHGFSKYFRNSSDAEREIAILLINFQNARGGRVVFQNIPKPDRDDWGTAADAAQAALTFEKGLNQILIDLQKVAEKQADSNLDSFLDEHLLERQVVKIKRLADLAANLKRVGSGLGEFQYDQVLHQGGAIIHKHEIGAVKASSEEVD